MDRHSISVGSRRNPDHRHPGRGGSSHEHSAETPLLVCLPGGSCNGGYFDVPGFSLLSAASRNGFTAVALDRPWRCA